MANDLAESRLRQVRVDWGCYRRFHVISQRDLIYSRGTQNLMELLRLEANAEMHGVES